MKIPENNSRTIPTGKTLDGRIPGQAKFTFDETDINAKFVAREWKEI